MHADEARSADLHLVQPCEGNITASDHPPPQSLRLPSVLPLRLGVANTMRLVLRYLLLRLLLVLPLFCAPPLRRIT
jgi:hypothetical protein